MISYNVLTVAGKLTDIDVKTIQKKDGTSFDIMSIIVTTTKKTKVQNTESFVDEPNPVKFVISKPKTVEFIKNYRPLNKTVMVTAQVINKSWEKDGKKFSINENVVAGFEGKVMLFEPGSEGQIPSNDDEQNTRSQNNNGHQYEQSDQRAYNQDGDPGYNKNTVYSKKRFDEREGSKSIFDDEIPF